MASASENPGLRVLITGLDGFTGRYVNAELADAGHRIFGLTTADGAPVDLLDQIGVRKAIARIQPQAVIHLAAVSYAAHGDVDAIYRTNVVGTHHLLSALASLPEPPTTTLLASSAHVYGHAQGRLDELAPLAPVNDYAVSKVAMEYMATTWSAHLPLLIARPFNYTGVGQADQFLIPKIVNHFRRGERHIELGNLDVWREFMDVRTVAWAYRRLLETDGDTAVLNICVGASHSLREVLGMMAEIAGYAIEVSVNPAFVRANEMQRLEGDPGRLLMRIGAGPSITLKDTLRWMYEFPGYRPV